MKKFITLLLTILCAAIICVGCAAAPQTQLSEKFDKRKPWISHSTNFISETTSYKVTKNFVKDEDTKIAVNDDSSYLKYTITRSYDESGSTFYTLKTDFKIKYNDSEYIDLNFRNKTDAISSEAVFRGDNLAAVTTKKIVTLETSPQNSYSYEVDYNEGKANFTSNNENSILTFEKGTYYDNEYLYYIIRTFKTTDGAMSETFDIINWYECFLAGKVEKTPMVAAFYKSESVAVPDNILTGFSGEGKDSQNKTIKCNTVQLRLNRVKTGAPIYLSYAATPYEETKDEVVYSSNKLLALIITFENTSRGTITFQTEYSLNDFEQISD